MVLSACSAYFQKILLDNPCKHPTIILPSDICFSDLQFIIEFVYRGEIDVSEAELQVCSNKKLTCHSHIDISTTRLPLFAPHSHVGKWRLKCGNNFPAFWTTMLHKNCFILDSPIVFVVSLASYCLTDGLQFTVYVFRLYKFSNSVCMCVYIYVLKEYLSIQI